MRGKENPLKKKLKDLISKEGPIDFGKYFVTALTDKDHGFYMNQDVFNKQGHFITSPELSAVFGELIAVFVHLFWQQNGIESGERLKTVVELGPGTGALSIKLLESFHCFSVAQNIKYVFLEVSPFLSMIQQNKVNDFCMKKKVLLNYRKEGKIETLFNEKEKLSFVWVNSLPDLEEVSRSFGEEHHPFFLAHEFFDALPSLKFKQSRGAWREMLIGNSLLDSSHAFTVELGPENSSRVQNVLKPDQRFTDGVADGEEIEVSPISAFYMNVICDMASRANGCVMAVDYGENESFTDSLTGIYQHKYVPQKYILEFPGFIDLSYFVDFKNLGFVAQHNTLNFSIMPQAEFLMKMGLAFRCEALLNSTSDTAKKAIFESQIDRLVSPEHMGRIYKFLFASKQLIYPFQEVNE